jgi:hypothetical protein
VPWCRSRRRSPWTSCDARQDGAPWSAHTVMLEKNRMQFFHEILGLLDESDATALK